MSSCPHGFAKTSQCVACMYDGEIDNEWRKVGVAIRSKYGQDCAACGQQLSAGMWVQRWDRGDPPTATVYTCPLCEPTS